MNDMTNSRLPRETAETFNPMIGALPAETLQGVPNILAMLSNTLSEGSLDKGERGNTTVLESAQFALRYEANQTLAHADAQTRTTGNWYFAMLNRRADHARAN